MTTLKEVRIARNISQATISEQTGLSRAAISRAESGKPAREKTIDAICKVLEVDQKDITGITFYSAVASANKRTVRKKSA